MSRNIGYAWLMLACVLANPAVAQEVNLPSTPPVPVTAAKAPADPAEAKKAQDELEYRVALGRAEDIKLMLGKGANPDASNKEGKPLLLVAAARKDAEALSVVQALLEGGANVNIKDSNGQTALYYAARSGKPEVVDYLLKNKIDYYSLDNNGDIARTIAYRLGRDAIVTIMDDFVKAQTFQAQLTYQNAEKMAAEQQAELDRKAKEEADRIKREAAEQREKAKQERQRKIAEYQENLKKLDGMVYDISYNACAFQYWSFCLAANQTTELSDEQTEETIEIHKTEVQDVSLEVMKMFNVDGNYVNRIIIPSKQSVYDQLTAMPSRTYRKENGVGKLTDVHARCDKIAKNWVITVPKQPQAADQPGPTKPKSKHRKKKVKPKPYPDNKMTFPGGVDINNPPDQ